MFTDITGIPFELQVDVLTCRVMQGSDYDWIEQKTRVKTDVAVHIVEDAKIRAGSEDFRDNVACAGGKTIRGKTPE